ncbi:MAG: DUF2256 domain-containing protein [Gemmataceae bacterium]|nr:DUF2256 domain-containing protein [Gemmataceae bacterium]
MKDIGWACTEYFTKHKWTNIIKPKPQKICLSCNKPYSWRKKWEKVWSDVKYCSERCRRNWKSSQ